MVSLWRAATITGPRHAGLENKVLALTRTNFAGVHVDTTMPMDSLLIAMAAMQNLTVKLRNAGKLTEAE